MFVLYGKLWEREHSGSPTEYFDRFAASKTPEELQRIIKRAQQEIGSGNAFPPSLGELDSWATIPTESEFIEIGSRIMAGRYSNEIESWLVRKRRYNLRRATERDFDKKLKRYYIEAAQLQREGRLFEQESEVLSLPTTSEINANDRHRIDFDSDTTGKTTAARVEVSAMMARIRARVSKKLEGSENDLEDLPEL